MPPDHLAGLLTAATARLKEAGCDTPVLDARLLLQEAAGISREDLILGPDRILTPQQMALFESFLERRERHEPVSRILGIREFYGRAFRVTPDTLDPRPDTETLVDAALAVMPPGRAFWTSAPAPAPSPSPCWRSGRTPRLLPPIFHPKRLPWRGRMRNGPGWRRASALWKGAGSIPFRGSLTSSCQIRPIYRQTISLAWVPRCGTSTPAWPL